MSSVTLSKRNGHLHAARRDSDHLAPVGRRHDSFIKVERSVAGNVTRGTDVGKQEVLDRFFRVLDNNVQKTVLTRKTSRECIGVERKMECCRLLKYD